MSFPIIYSFYTDQVLCEIYHFFSPRYTARQVGRVIITSRRYESRRIDIILSNRKRQVPVTVVYPRGVYYGVTSYSSMMLTYISKKNAHSGHS
jgi:hypothetical protein